MDPFTHLIITFIWTVAAYILGWYFGHKQGNILGAAVVLEWVERKVGKYNLMLGCENAKKNRCLT